MRLVALDIAVVGRELGPYVDHSVRCKRRKDGEVVSGDIIERGARHRPSEFGVFLVLRREL